MIRFVAEGLLIFIQIYYFIIFARIIMSWVMMGGQANPTLSGIYQILYGVTEPLLAPLRRVIPSIRMGGGYLDLSPIVLLILVRILQQVIYRYLYF
ncbi:MAG: YggT family protein [Bacillota bacterium]